MFTVTHSLLRATQFSLSPIPISLPLRVSGRRRSCHAFRPNPPRTPRTRGSPSSYVRRLAPCVLSTSPKRRGLAHVHTTHVFYCDLGNNRKQQHVNHMIHTLNKVVLLQCQIDGGRVRLNLLKTRSGGSGIFEILLLQIHVFFILLYRFLCTFDYKFSLPFKSYC